MPVAVLCISAALGAVAFATALRPHGYEQASGLALALLLGVAVLLAIFLVLRSLFGHLHPAHGSRVRYLALAAALGLLVGGAAVRSLAGGTGAGDRRAQLAQERQEFHRWTPTAVPLIVRYGDALRADAPLVRRPSARRPQAGLRARVERAERILLGLQRASGPLVASSPADLRSLMPLLRRALALAVAAQRAYAAGLSRRAGGMRRAAGGRGSTALLRRGTRLLRSSDEAMAAFTLQVNTVGAQLATGRLPSAPGR
jgi:hypothetical protein